MLRSGKKANILEAKMLWVNSKFILSQKKSKKLPRKKIVKLSIPQTTHRKPILLIVGGSDNNIAKFGVQDATPNVIGTAL